MIKVAIKSEKLSPFWGIFSKMEKFDSKKLASLLPDSASLFYLYDNEQVIEKAAWHPSYKPKENELQLCCDGNQILIKWVSCRFIQNSQRKKEEDKEYDDCIRYGIAIDDDESLACRWCRRSSEIPFLRWYGIFLCERFNHCWNKQSGCVASAIQPLCFTCL